MANIAGLSSLGVRLGYAVETVAGEMPTVYKMLERCNSIGGIDLETETIDASALEDFVERSVAGRQGTGGTWAITFNLTDEVIDQLETMISEYNALTDGKKMWLEVWAPGLTRGFFVSAQPPQYIPMPEMGQNELMTIEIVFAIEEYAGMKDAIKPLASDEQ